MTTVLMLILSAAPAPKFDQLAPRPVFNTTALPAEALSSADRADNPSPSRFPGAASAGQNNEPAWLGVWSASWCGSCAQQATAADALAAEGYDVRTIDYDANQEAGRGWKITTLPTLSIYRGSEEVDRKVGLVPLGPLRAWIQNHNVRRRAPQLMVPLPGG